MASVLFIDDRLHEVMRQWEASGCERRHRLLPFEAFVSVDRTVERVRALRPDAVVIGFFLGDRAVTGADVVRALERAGYDGTVIANGGSGRRAFVDAGADVTFSACRTSEGLRRTLEDV